MADNFTAPLLDQKKRGHAAVGFEYVYDEPGRKVVFMHESNARTDVKGARRALRDWANDDNAEYARAALLYECATLLSPMTVEPEREEADQIVSRS